MDSNPPGTGPQPALDPEDYYFEGPNMVFTRAYLLKRGYCCSSGCRHCPYGFAGAAEPATPDPAPTGAALPKD